MNEPTIHLVKTYKSYFVRNKDHSIFFKILDQDRARTIVLNIFHNIIEVYYYIGQMGIDRKGNTWEKTDLDWFGASFEILDALFDKYKDNKEFLTKLTRFVMRSKSRSYWSILKDKPYANEVIAIMLGAPDDEHI